MTEFEKKQSGRIYEGYGIEKAAKLCKRSDAAIKTPLPAVILAKFLNGMCRQVKWIIQAIKEQVPVD